MKRTKKSPIRASLPKTALPRIYFIDREIASGKYPNTGDLVRRLLESKGDPLSLSTISRDIDFINPFIGGFPLAAHNAHNALDDAMICGRLALMSAEKFGSINLGDLLTTAGVVMGSL
jgi:hypothetical protein